MNRPIEEFVQRCLPPMNAHRSGDREVALEMLKSAPDWATADFRCALLTGQLECVRRALAEDPDIANREFLPDGWQPLLYVCFSLFYRDDLSRRNDFHAIAKLLLAHGADPNCSFMLGEEKETALYGATGVCNDATMGAILIDAGADVNDEDASYHIAEHDTCESVKLFVERGMRKELLATALLHKLDYDDLDGVRTMLDLGLDPNGRGGWGKTPLHQAIMRGRSDAFLELLIERGADLNATADDGRSVYAMAARIGRKSAMELLSRAGADTNLRTVDELFAACAAGDAGRSKEIISKNPGLVSSMNHEDKVAIVEAAREGNTQAVTLMVEAGIDVNTRGACGGSALHWAAWTGRPETATALVELGAPMEMRCHSYDCTPLGWAVYGEKACGHPDGEYLKLVELLLDAGAMIEPDMLADATEETRKVLNSRGTQ